MGDTSGVWVNSPVGVSVSSQSTRSARCEDCGREWTAVCVDVPVSIFIQDLDDYYRRLSNHLLELNVPPLVMCIFQPSGEVSGSSPEGSSPEGTTLSYVAPQQKSGFKWRINHKGLGHKANSGCQIIPCTDKYLASDVHKSKEERDAEDHHDVVQIKQERDTLNVEEDHLYPVLEVRTVSSKFFESEEDSSMDFQPGEEKDPLFVDAASSSCDTPANREDSIVSGASSESRRSHESPLNTQNSGIPASVSKRIGEIIPASEVNREAISVANTNIYAVPSTSKSQSAASGISGSSNLPSMKTQETRMEVNNSSEEENKAENRERSHSEINSINEMNSDEPKEIQLTKEVSLKEIKEIQNNDSEGEKSEKPWWEQISISGSYGSNANASKQPTAAQNLLNQLQKNQLQENQRNNGANSMHMNQFQFPPWQYGYPGFNFFDDNRIKTEVEEIDHTQNSFQNGLSNFFPNHDIFNLPMFLQNSLAQRQKYSGEKHYECTICNKRYVSKQNLKAHMSSHSGEKLFECPICRKRFTWKASLRTHMLGHSNDKPFHCPICNKGYNQKINLKAHMYTHTGEKPFKCPMCDQCFTQDGILKNHLLTHGEKTFECPICGKRFYQKGGLKSHLQTHSKHGEAAMGYPDHLLHQNGDSSPSASMSSSSMFGESSHSLFQQLLNQFSSQNNDSNNPLNPLSAQNNDNELNPLSAQRNDNEVTQFSAQNNDHNSLNQLSPQNNDNEPNQFYSQNNDHNPQNQLSVQNNDIELNQFSAQNNDDNELNQLTAKNNDNNLLNQFSAQKDQNNQESQANAFSSNSLLPSRAVTNNVDKSFSSLLQDSENNSDNTQVVDDNSHVADGGFPSVKNSQHSQS